MTAKIGLRDVRLNFHSWSKYEECPKKFKLSEDRVPKTEPQDEYYAVFGSVVQKYFEYFCNSPESNYTKASSREEVSILLQPLWDKAISRATINWKGFGKRLSPEAYFESAVDCVWECLKSDIPIRGFVSEIKLVEKMKSGDSYVGVLDFVKEIKDEEGNVIDGIILDGKTTDKLGKNLSKDQLLSYAYLFYKKNGVVPSKVGFYYYRLRVAEMYDVTLEDIEVLRKKLLVGLMAIKTDAEFKATPSSNACKYCDWRSSCQEYIEGKKKRNAEKTAKTLSGPPRGVTAIS